MLMPILKSLLGSDCRLNSLGVVCSLPDAPAQPMHRDGGGLFLETPLDALLPPCAITVAIPLLEMNEHRALCPGSHRDWSSLPSTPSLVPRVGEGAALLWDYRLAHQGTANISGVPRPLLYLTYCRPWFFDHHNFSEQTPLAIDEDAYERLSPSAKQVMARPAFAGKRS